MSAKGRLEEERDHINARQNDASLKGTYIADPKTIISFDDIVDILALIEAVDEFYVGLELIQHEYGPVTMTLPDMSLISKMMTAHRVVDQ